MVEARSICAYFVRACILHTCRTTKRCWDHSYLKWWYATVLFQQKLFLYWHIFAALLCLMYGIFVSTFTQDQLKNGEQVTLPINESAVMNEHLAEWISEGVTIMNEKNRENVVHCWGNQGFWLFGMLMSDLFWHHRPLCKLRVSFQATIMMTIGVWLMRSRRLCTRWFSWFQQRNYRNSGYRNRCCNEQRNRRRGSSRRAACHYCGCSCKVKGCPVGGGSWKA